MNTARIARNDETRHPSKFQITFELGELPKLANQQLRQASWQAHRGEARKWKLRVYKAVQGRIPKEPLARAYITFTRVSTREPDFDGLVSSFKHITDGLVEARVIENDKVGNIGASRYVWEKGKRGQGKIRVQVSSEPPDTEVEHNLLEQVYEAAEQFCMTSNDGKLMPAWSFYSWLKTTVQNLQNWRARK